MPSLSQAPPPTPLRAKHVEEVQRAAMTIAASAVAYLRRLMDVLEYSRTDWARGTGIAARPGAVSATANGRTAAAPMQAPYVTGSDTPGTGAIANKPVLLAVMTGREQPVRSQQRFYDGLLISAVPDGAPLPPAVPRPVAPAPVDMTALDDETYAAYIQQWGAYIAAFIEWLVDKSWREQFADVTRFPTGTVEAVDVSRKTARVKLDAIGQGTEGPRQLCGFGNRQWTAAQLTGKHVRVGHSPATGYWVDDLNG